MTVISFHFVLSICFRFVSPEEREEQEAIFEARQTGEGLIPADEDPNDVNELDDHTTFSFARISRSRTASERLSSEASPKTPASPTTPSKIDFDGSKTYEQRQIILCARSVVRSLFAQYAARAGCDLDAGPICFSLPEGVEDEAVNVLSHEATSKSPDVQQDLDPQQLPVSPSPVVVGATEHGDNEEPPQAEISFPLPPTSAVERTSAVNTSVVNIVDPSGKQLVDENQLTREDETNQEGPMTSATCSTDERDIRDCIADCVAEFKETSAKCSSRVGATSDPSVRQSDSDLRKSGDTLLRTSDSTLRQSSDSLRKSSESMQKSVSSLHKTDSTPRKSGESSFRKSHSSLRKSGSIESKSVSVLISKTDSSTESQPRISNQLSNPSMSLGENIGLDEKPRESGQLSQCSVSFFGVADPDLHDLISSPGVPACNSRSPRSPPQSPPQRNSRTASPASRPSAEALSPQMSSYHAVLSPVLPPGGAPSPFSGRSSNPRSPGSPGDKSRPSSGSSKRRLSVLSSRRN